MNPFMAFCLYVAARVFVQLINKNPNDFQIRAALKFVLDAMTVIKRKNPLSESFLAQLDVDLAGGAADDLRTQTSLNIPRSMRGRWSESGGEAAQCSPMVNLEDFSLQNHASLATWSANRLPLRSSRIPSVTRVWPDIVRPTQTSPCRIPTLPTLLLSIRIRLSVMAGRISPCVLCLPPGPQEARI